MPILGTTDLGDGRLFVTVDYDPTSTGTDAPEGSIIFSTSTASHYGKDDDGSTTNVTLFGPPGPQGNQGNVGNTGGAGAQGNQGNVGSTGGAGAQGNQGNVGSAGGTGAQGNQGNVGNTGGTGAQGNQGNVGTGNQGNQGNQGTGGGSSLTTFEVTATGALTTTSLTDVLMTSMTLTPGAGTYLVLFHGDGAHNKNGQTTFTSIYSNGVQIAYSEANVGGQASNIGNLGTQATTTVADAQTIEVHWRVSSNSGGGQGTLTGPRSLILLQLS